MIIIIFEKDIELKFEYCLLFLFIILKNVFFSIFLNCISK